jgi:hypothetical protein
LKLAEKMVIMTGLVIAMEHGASEFMPLSRAIVLTVLKQFKVTAVQLRNIQVTTKYQNEKKYHNSTELY